MSEYSQHVLESRLELSERKRMRLQKMLSQKTAEKDTPVWSMVDLMTLLLVFCLFFYASSITDSAADSQHPPQNMAGQLTQAMLSQPTREAVTNHPESIQTRLNPSTSREKNDMLEHTIAQLRSDVMATMDDSQKDVFLISNDQRRLVFTLGERITFNLGEATLLEAYHSIFIRIAGFIASKPQYQVVVSGHTDNRPIQTQKYPSNLELSASRAINVARFLMENGVAPQRVSIQGFSEYRPLVENTTPQNRQKNRRVEITLIKGQEIPRIYPDDSTGTIAGRP
jgi:chemotaxis protein MotB